MKPRSFQSRHVRRRRDDARDLMKHKISIALCTYNGAKYLSSQLESYLAQTYPPGEVVVCDDCSQDETVSMLDEFARRAPFPVRILVNEQNIGSTKNFEKAISRCSGDIIFLSDQDDVWAPNKIERVVNEFDNDCEVGMVFSDAELVEETLQPLGSNLFDTFERPDVWRRGGIIKQEDLFSRLLKGNIVAGTTLAFRAKYNKAIIPIPTDVPQMIHDGWIAIVLSVTAKSVFLNEPLVKYRQHPEQQIGAIPRRHARPAFKPTRKMLVNSSRINLMESIEGTHKNRMQGMELLKSYMTPRIDAPERIMNVVNEEKDYHQECARHFHLRKSLLSYKHKMRLWPIIKELLSGRYHRCSNGIRSAAGDFMAFTEFSWK